jgi:ABC-type glycerol-3-phosphate transport system substrate-binding protein
MVNFLPCVRRSSKVEQLLLLWVVRTVGIWASPGVTIGLKISLQKTPIGLPIGTGTKLNFSDANMKENFTEYVNLWRKGYVEKGFLSTGDNQIVSFLISGKAAMFISGTWMIQQIIDADPEFEFGWAPIPDDDGSLKMMYGPSLAGWAMSKEASMDPLKVKAFERFMTFWYAEENYKEYLQKTNQFFCC